MSVFADASALVKLYADEEDHGLVRQLDAVAVAEISRVEVPAALWRKQRIGELRSEHAQVLTASFEADYFGTAGEPPRFSVVSLSARLLDHAARLCAVHALRGFDAVQLACALAARLADGDCTVFAAFDAGLRRAAASEGFQLLPHG
ncbi:MAG: type II toxin-antitoxin system VapC family toxin [Acidimicrobiales bacterium]